MPQPQTFLIQIVVTLNPDAPPTTRIRSFYNSKIKADPLATNVGDHVGWLVQVAIGHEAKFVPYTIDFSKNPSFFGMSSLNVPNGGPSPFLRVLALLDHVKYSVNIPGLATIDPDIQSGGDTTFGGFDITHSVSYDVYWDTAHPTNPMQYAIGGGSRTELPLTVKVGDQITFHASVVGSPAISNFAVVFSQNGWFSPFDPNHGRFTANGAGTTIGPKPVKDSDDPGLSFGLTASITLNGQDVKSNNANNAIVMSASGGT